MHRYLKAAVALLSLPALIDARSTFYARDAEAEAIANPHAYPNANADAYAGPYDNPTYLSKRELEGIVYLAERDAYAHAYAEAYANALALAEPDAAADYEGFLVYERSPMPAGDLTPDQVKKCTDLKNRATAQYKSAQRDYDAAVRSYNNATAQNKKAEAQKAYDAAKR